MAGETLFLEKEKQKKKKKEKQTINELHSTVGKYWKWKYNQWS